MNCVFDNDVIGIINYKVGDKVKELFHSHVVLREMEEETCTVVYVHPKGRFYTCEFDFNGTKMRESYTVRSDINPTRLSWFR